MENKKEDTSLKSEYEIPIAEYFKLNAKKKLGSGAFGEIYHGNLLTKELI